MTTEACPFSGLSGLDSREMMTIQNNLKRNNTERITVKKTIGSLKKTFRQICDKELPLDHLVFLYTAAAGIIMSTLGLSYNMLAGLGIFSLPVLVLYLVLTLSCVLYSIIKEHWYGAAVIVIGVSTFLMIPFLWFTIGGATGSTAPIMLTAGLCIAIVFKGAVRTAMLAAEAVMLVAFVALEYHIPNIIIAYPDRTSHYSDLAFGLAMSLMVNSILAYTVMDQYARVRDQKTQLAHQLELLSLTDALTGLYNRRFLSTSIDEEMHRAYKTGSQLTLCMLDIDRFKVINDTYGHEYGDDVLINIARIMRAKLTKGEIFGRYGGEEFVVLFPGKTPSEALPTVQALADSIRTHTWKHGKPVTVSGGMSAYVKGFSYSEFVDDADKNLYRAKREGRNRIIL